jgi:hypothetical protein
MHPNPAITLSAINLHSLGREVSLGTKQNQHGPDHQNPRDDAQRGERSPEITLARME